MSNFKIVSDFDGVWTNQAGEANVIWERLLLELSRATGESHQAMTARAASLRSGLHDAPHAHGWAPQGRITAFVDEDPLCNVNALCRHLEFADTPELLGLRDAVLGAGFDSLYAFAEHCFVQGMADYRSKNAPCIVPHARDVLTALRDAGADVVVVSNSESEKLIDYFGSAGIEASEAGNGTLRVRGAAAKWALGDTPEELRVHDRKIYVDRPRYRKTLEEEQPDLVIGDVFSLDLSLPHVMRLRGENGAPQLLALRKHGHTPSWVAEDRADGAIDHVIDELMELVDIVRGR